jgi:hypothetical protein
MMKRLMISAILASLLFVLFVPNTSAKDKEYEAIAKHLQSKFQAKRVKMPFMWLARFAVRVVKPAGVKSFNVTMFENLNFSRDTLDEEMQSAMSDSLSKDWLPILRVRSRDGEQVYAYMRENGKDVKMMLVTIDKNEAALIRATFNPDKLAEFINNPRIFGVSLGDDKTAQIKDSPPDSKETK